MKNLVRIISILIISVIVQSCKSMPVAQFENLNYWPTEKWMTDSPESQGVDSKELMGILEKIDNENLLVDSIVVIRNGVKIMDAVKYPYKRDIPHNLYSCTKSVMSILIGIAIDKGYIGGVDTPVLSFFSEYSEEELYPGWDKITLKHLLTMTSGITNDFYAPNSSNYWTMQDTDDWVDFILSSRLYTKPEIQKFSYSNMTSFLLGAILNKQTGQSPLDFANENLFKPLGITNLSWSTTSPDGVHTGATDLNLMTTDFAKIGLLFLQNGNWEGKQIVSEEWVLQSTAQQVVDASPMGKYGYGYQWWKDAADGYYALGSFGQFLIVNPGKNLLVVVNSSISDSEYYKYISIKEEFNHKLTNTFTETVLPDKTSEYDMLIKKIQDWESELNSEDVGNSDKFIPLNKKYKLEDNIWEYDSLKLVWDGSKGSILLNSEFEDNTILELNLDGKYIYDKLEYDHIAYRTYIDDDGDITLVFRNLTEAYWFKYVINIQQSEIVIDISHNTWIPEGDFQIKGYNTSL